MYTQYWALGQVGREAPIPLTLRGTGVESLSNVAPYISPLVRHNNDVVSNTNKSEIANNSKVSFAHNPPR